MKPEHAKIFGKMADGDLLGLLMYGEARGESLDGKVAVACVVRNRSVAWEKSYFDIISAKNQFSCFNSNDPNYNRLLEMATDIFSKKLMPEDLTNRFQECRWLAFGVVNKSIRDNTKGGLYYYNPKIVAPSWAEKMTVTVKIGNHVFLKE